MDLAKGRLEGSAGTALDVGEDTREFQCVGELASHPVSQPRLSGATVTLYEGALLSGRYRMLQPIAGGWLAFDERLSRPVFVAAIAGRGERPAERVRREAAQGAPLVDAIIAGDTAFAVRAMSHTP